MTVRPLLTPDDNATRTTLVVSEIFGPTLQGEGPSAGQSAGFLRLGGCNLSCRWCDSSYTWDASRHDLHAELTRVHIDKILTELLGFDTPVIVVTGGEPLLHQHQPAWRALLTELYRAGKRVEIETNGTVSPDPHTTHRVAQYNVSPKLAHAGMPAERRLVAEALRDLNQTGKAIFKFVCRTPEDVDDVAAIIAAHEIPHDRTWIMPEGVTAASVAATLEVLVNRTIAHRFHLSGRLHVLLWGAERGR